MSEQGSEREQVVEVCTRMAWYADQRLWDRYDEVLAERVRVDYTSLTGGEPAELGRDELVASWQASLGRLDATQHLVGNHLVLVHGDDATCTATFQATHVLANRTGGSRWTLGGTYHYALNRTAQGWRIGEVTMTVVWADGNQQIMSAG
jgi:hypothetical protein